VTVPAGQRNLGSSHEHEEKRESSLGRQEAWGRKSRKQKVDAISAALEAGTYYTTIKHLHFAAGQQHK
jgi:hypothetical protein